MCAALITVRDDSPAVSLQPVPVTLATDRLARLVAWRREAAELFTLVSRLRIATVAAAAPHVPSNGGGTPGTSSFFYLGCNSHPPPRPPLTGSIANRRSDISPA